MRAVFHSVSTQGDDTLQVVQTLPNSGLLAFVRGPWPSTTHLHQDASSILRAQSSQFFGQFFYACACCGHLQASVDPFSARSNRRTDLQAHEERPSCGLHGLVWQAAFVPRGAGPLPAQPSIDPSCEGLATNESIEVGQKQRHKAVVFVAMSAGHVGRDEAVGRCPQRVLGWQRLGRGHVEVGGAQVAAQGFEQGVRAARSAAWSTVAPRPMFMKIAPGFMASNFD